MFFVPAINIISSTGASLDAATSAWVAQVVSNGGTVSGGRQTLVNTLIVGLKSDGIWTKLDRLWLFAAENSQSALTDLVGLALATAVSSPTFTPDGGYAGNASSGLVDTNFNLSTDGVTYTLNSAHVSAWDTTSGGTTATRLVGLGGGFNATNIYPSFAGNLYCRINSDGTAGFANPTTRGFMLGNRSASNAIQVYKDGSSLGSDTTASDSLNNSTLRTHPAETNTDQVAQLSTGGSLTGTEVGNFYSRLRTYMTAVGVP